MEDTKIKSEKENKNKKQAKRYQEKSKKLNKKKVIIIVIMIILSISILCYFVFFNKKFQDINIELGTQKVELNQFLRNERYLENSKIITDMATIDFSKVGKHEIRLLYKNREEKVFLNIIDTTAPVVEFKNLDKYVNYQLNADDFIKSKTDLSEITTSIINPPEIIGIGTYEIIVEVKDSSNNITANICKLNVSRVVKEYKLELGEKLEKQNILLNYEEDKDGVEQSKIDEINKKDVGEYNITVSINGEKEDIKIIIADTTGPKLELKNVSIYDDEKIKGKEDFIKSVTDASKDIKTTLKTEINYSKIGEQEIIIEAEDKYGNKSEEKATLTIKRDTEAPELYGLGNMSVEKNSSVDYKKGVRAVDSRDGTCSFTVDSSKVNISKAGTYYISYTTKDKRGNSRTAKRKIVVNHNQEDTNNKFNEYYNNNLKGKSVASMVSTIRQMDYNSNWGGNDPIWYGLTKHTGNCYVHALLVQKALNKAGITNRLIYTTDKTHYWNLVYENGSWWHYDSTPGGHLLGPVKDEEKLNSSSMRGRKWSDSFPKAE